MIIYNLGCENGHRFEGWFKTVDDFGHQHQQGLLQCPVCGGTGVSKLPTASRVHTRQHGSPVQEVVAATGQTFLARLHQFVDENFTDVGTGFPEEARKIYYGETAARNIRGIASVEDARALHEEGVPVTPLPPQPVDKSSLN